MKPTMFVTLSLVAILAFALIAGCDEKAEDPASGPAAGKTLVITEITAFDAGEYASTTKVGDVTQNRNQLVTLTQDASDDRLDGAGEWIVSNDGRDDGSSTGWGTMKFTNDGGTWEGDWSGASEAKVDGNIYVLAKLTGTGDYEGLIAYLIYVNGPSLGFPEAPSASSGYIEQAE